MSLIRPPIPALRLFVDSVWACPAREPVSGAVREHVLPSGAMHLAIRLDAPLRLFDAPTDRVGQVVGNAVVAGARAGFYAKDISIPSASVGAQLRPGAALALFGLPADALAGRHVALADLWGVAEVDTLQEQLQEQTSLERRLQLLETCLAARLPKARGMHPAMANALAHFNADTTVRELVAGSGYSHRGFIALFRQTTGLPPKQYQRVLRFGHSLQAMSRSARNRDEAFELDAYSDQSHFIREFRAFAGMTPQAWLRSGAANPHHVPVD